MCVHEFKTEVWLPLPPSELFPFFAEASNLNLITPEWLHFHIVSPSPIVMGAGTLIDYRLRVRGIPMRWRTRIIAWEPPHRFVDEQMRGPYRQWIHEHRFLERDGGTLVQDSVRYSVWLDFLVHRFLVRGDIERIFSARSEALRARFAS